jgi:hypothetical protein
VDSTGIDKVGHSQLLDASQPLEIGVVDDSQYQWVVDA